MFWHKLWNKHFNVGCVSHLSLMQDYNLISVVSLTTFSSQITLSVGKIVDFR